MAAGADVEVPWTRDPGACSMGLALGYEGGDALEPASALEFRIESVLDGKDDRVWMEAFKDGGVVVALGAENDQSGISGVPVLEEGEASGLAAVIDDLDARFIASVDLLGIGIDEFDLMSPCQQSVSDRAADATGAEDRDGSGGGHGLVPGSERASQDTGCLIGRTEAGFRYIQPDSHRISA